MPNDSRVVGSMLSGCFSWRSRFGSQQFCLGQLKIRRDLAMSRCGKRDPFQIESFIHSERVTCPDLLSDAVVFPFMKTIIFGSSAIFHA